MEKIIASILAALSPIFFSFVFKNLENRNKTSIRKNNLDEAQKRIDFLKSYYLVQNDFIEMEASNQLKQKLSVEIQEVKAGIDELYRKQEVRVGKLFLFQRILLTYKPLSVWGWIWHICFYLNLIFLFFLGIGIVTDDNGNYSRQAFSDNMANAELVLGSILFILFAAAFYAAAIISYKISSKNDK